MNTTTTANPVRDAAERLEDLTYHLDRFDSPAALARHLRATHDRTLHGNEEDDLTALREMHAAGHADALAEAAGALHDAEEATADGQAGPCRYAAAHQGIPATTTIDCGPVGIVPACQPCADFYARMATPRTA